MLTIVSGLVMIIAFFVMLNAHKVEVGVGAFAVFTISGFICGLS